MNTFPKVAVLSSTNISGKSATGSLMSSLFHGWPSEQLLQVTKLNNQDEVAGQFQAPFPFYDFLEQQRQSKNPALWFVAAGLRKALFPLKLSQGNKKAVLNYLKEEKVEILYLRVEAEPFYFLTMARFLKEELDIPLVLHFMDDFGTLLRMKATNNPVQSYYARFYEKMVKELVKLADKVLVISDSMKERYEALYSKKPMEVFHNGIYPALFEKMQTTSFEPKEVHLFRFFWAGSIAPHKDDVVINAIAQAIQSISDSRPDKKVEFLLNVPGLSMSNAKKLAAQFTSVRFQGYQPIEDYHRLLATSDVLIIGRNFDDFTKAYTELSFHNKLPDFLSAGRPIAVIAPEWDNTARIFKKYDFGPVVHSENTSTIQACFGEIMKDYPTYLQKAKDATSRAYPIYNMETTRNRFQASLASVVK